MKRKEIYSILKNDKSLKLEKDVWDNIKNGINLKSSIIPTTKIKRFSYQFAIYAIFIVVFALGILELRPTNVIYNKSNEKYNSSPIENSKSVNNILDKSSNFSKSNANNLSSSSNINKGPAIHLAPIIINYDHRLYVKPLLDSDNKTVNVVNIIGQLSWIKIYSIQNTAISNSIAVEDPYPGKSSNYIKYDFLCRDSFTINGSVYNLNDKHGQSDILNISQSSDGILTNESQVYIIKLITNYPQITKILDQKLGTIGTGTLYKVDEIDISQAVVLNADNEWFTITKEYEYNGKTIDTVLKEKGLK